LDEPEEAQRLNMGRDVKVAELNRETKKLKERIKKLEKKG
jgi:hypothetical protein